MTGAGDVLAFDVGGTNLRGARVGGDGAIAERRAVPTPAQDPAALTAAPERVAVTAPAAYSATLVSASTAPVGTLVVASPLDAGRP